MIDYTELPVYKSRDEILSSLENNQVIIVESPTGSGKTTQIPLILNDAGYTEKGIIGITQPRRIAAVSVSEFIKRQINDTGAFCGYTMRFHDTTDSTTRIKIMTDGIILQEVKADPLLSRYSVIMVDEAHERSLNIDFILGLLKEIIVKRPELKVIISSATINTSSFSQFFGGAPIVSISGHPFPVTVNYCPCRLERENEDEFYAKITSLVKNAHEREDGGDVLVFLPGEAEIKQCMETLYCNLHNDDYEIYPLYGRLSKEEQDRVFIPTTPGKTKVVVATNVAETSLTIDGIRTVIDSGWAKTNFYNQRNFTSSLIPTLISRSSADQRKGRAGRTQSGVCYRLYSEEDYTRRREFNEEEILHSDLAEVVLRMCELGIYNPTSFPFITPPKPESLLSAIETLKYIGAIKENLHLTSIGEMMIQFPLLPRLSRVIVEAIINYPAVVEPVVTAVSFLSTKTPFILPPGKEYEAREVHHMMVDNVNGDFAAYLSIYKSYLKNQTERTREKYCTSHFLDKQTMDEIVHIKGQLEDIVSGMGVPISGAPVNIPDYLICLASGLRQYICIKTQGYSYRSMKASEIYIHPGSSWFMTRPQFILAGELVKTSKMYARSVSPLRAEWIKSISPELLKELMTPINSQRDKKESVKEDKSLEQYRVNKGRCQYIVPIAQLKKITDRSDKKIYISCENVLSLVPIKTKLLDREYALVLRENKLIKKKKKGHFTPYDADDIIKNYLKNMLRPFKAGKCFEYLFLDEDNDTFFINVTSSIEKAVASSIYALTALLDLLPEERTELRKKVGDYIDRYDRFSGEKH